MLWLAISGRRLRREEGEELCLVDLKKGEAEV